MSLYEPMDDERKPEWFTQGKIMHEWDGVYEEGILPRPDKKYPWVYVIQHADEGGLCWGIYSQSTTRPFATGRDDGSVLDVRRVVSVRACELNFKACGQAY